MSRYPEVVGPGVDDSPGLKALLDSLLEQYGSGINAMLLYGSCLRNGNIYDGLLDIYLICDNYRGIYRGAILPTANWLLPPNVFYGEVELGKKTLRSKYSIVSSNDFRRGCSRRRFESYLWGRFSQPVKIIYCRDSLSRRNLEDSLLSAARTFLHRTLPLLPESGTVSQLWQDSLAHSYATELRTERSERTNELAQSSEEFFAEITRQASPGMVFPLQLLEGSGELCYRAQVPGWRRLNARMGWAARRIQGKLMSILRVVKALFTFQGGLDYVAWKLERHSGQEVIIPERVRRYPLIFLWGFFWGLYRQGIFK